MSSFVFRIQLFSLYELAGKRRKKTEKNESDVNIAMCCKIATLMREVKGMCMDGTAAV